MTAAIAPLPPSLLVRTEPLVAPTLGAPQAASGVDFGRRVAAALGEVSELQGRATAAAEGLSNGQHQDVHGTMIAMQEADIAFRLLTSVRNRAVEAYREVMRMSG